MQPEVAKRLLDAIESAKQIQNFTAGLDLTRFSASKLVRSAVERQFEIIGEALSKADATDPDLRVSIPELPKIVGLRNRLIHGYDSVDDEIIWDIVQTKISPLLEQLQNELALHGYSSDFQT